MANKQHVDIADPDIHEPKGVSTALANTAYVANGSGSGVWKKIGSTILQGLTGDAGVANLKVLTDGSGGFRTVTDSVYGSMVLNGNTNAFTVGAATDPLLNSNSDYVLFSGTGAPWLAGSDQYGVGFSVDRLTVATAGVYRVDFWGTIAGYPTPTSKVSIKTRVNGTALSVRHPLSRSSVSGDVGSIGGFEIRTLSQGDYIQLAVASTGAGGLILSDVCVTLTLLRAN